MGENPLNGNGNSVNAKLAERYSLVSRPKGGEVHQRTAGSNDSRECTKGYSMHILEQECIQEFRSNFLKTVFYKVADEHITEKAFEKACHNGTELDKEKEKLKKQFDNCGGFLFSFDSATPAALKQLRQKLLMANCGALSFEGDEVGSNLLNNADIFPALLELYDMGFIKQKLVKNTLENGRGDDLSGSTPTNLMLFGTPAKLFDGAKTESDFISLLDTGYSRRCFFGYIPEAEKEISECVSTTLQNLSNTNDHQVIEDFASHFGALADVANVHFIVNMDTEVTKALLEYRLHNQRLAQALPEHKSIQKAELQHRDSKVRKLAGALAFFELSENMTMNHLHYAIRLAEDSGDCLQAMLNQKKPYQRLADYIASEGRELTSVDIAEDLLFFKGSEANKRQLMDMAIAYGYRNGMLIKRLFKDGLEMFKGEMLEATDINKLKVSYSNQITDGYKNVECSLEQLKKLIKASGFHWVNHHLEDKQ